MPANSFLCLRCAPKKPISLPSPFQIKIKYAAFSNESYLLEITEVCQSDRKCSFLFLTDPDSYITAYCLWIQKKWFSLLYACYSSLLPKSNL